MKTIKSKTGKKINGNIVKNNFNSWLLIIPAVLCVYFIVIRPQITGIYWSFFNMKGYTIQSFAGLDNYKRVLSDTRFLQTLVNTLQYVFWSLVIGFPIPIILSLVLNEMVHCRNGFRFWVYFPSALPSVAVMTLWYMIYYPDQGGLLNMILIKFGFQPYVWLQDPKFAILGVILSITWNGCGATAIYYFACLQGISRELYEAALIDGAGFMKRFWAVTFPHMSGIVLLFLIRQIISIFSIMEQPLQMTGGGPNGASYTLGLLAYDFAFPGNRPQLGLAIGVIMFVILLVFTCFYFYLNKKVEDSR